MLRSRTRPLRSLAAVIVLAVAALAALPAGADTASDLAAARKAADEAQAAATAMAKEFSEAEGRYEEISNRIGVLEASMAEAQARMDQLGVEVRARALQAYVRRGAGTNGIENLISTSGPMQAARRAQFLDQANQASDRAVRELARTKEDLAVQRAELRQQREAQQQVRDQLAARNAELQEAFNAAARARDELAAKLEREKEAAAQAEAARLRAIAAASRAATGGGGAGQVIANPGGGPFQCPILGAAYTDDFGSRGGGYHYGIDMFAPIGTPLTAVKAGTFFTMSGGSGGNEVYLNADDGNTYYYAHLSQYAGGPRAVVQGEIVGFVGMTGNTSGPHLHFEIRLGGPNGQKIDPYPTLRQAGC